MGRNGVLSAKYISVTGLTGGQAETKAHALVNEITLCSVMQAKLLPKVDFDFDEVYDLGPVSESTGLRLRNDGHCVIDPGDSHGQVEVLCPYTLRRYLHIIHCPNKFNLKCRGCRAIV